MDPVLEGPANRIGVLYASNIHCTHFKREEICNHGDKLHIFEKRLILKYDLDIFVHVQ